ncbi:hypothetical protein EHO57_13760 [Leptospira langatensis]|uniref:Uncharacterized protein n=1 Tax=Leptospira langatensis TaxID=2484983 RepID=A0A5R2ASQ3_9LEPT|nr:hypothetical protein [Leptospira langatensis]TGJ99825.1 hypothetical protein EHO57_13760 [Leptospira langatensis]
MKTLNTKINHLRLLVKSFQILNFPATSQLSPEEFLRTALNHEPPICCLESDLTFSPERGPNPNSENLTIIVAFPNWRTDSRAILHVDLEKAIDAMIDLIEDEGLPPLDEIILEESRPEITREGSNGENNLSNS